MEEGFFPAMLEAIRSAQESVNFEALLFHSGEVGPINIADKLRLRHLPEGRYNHPHRSKRCTEYASYFEETANGRGCCIGGKARRTKEIQPERSLEANDQVDVRKAAS